jgi:hypothetical protein
VEKIVPCPLIPLLSFAGRNATETNQIVDAPVFRNVTFFDCGSVRLISHDNRLLRIQSRVIEVNALKNFPRVQFSAPLGIVVLRVVFTAGVKIDR